MRLLSDQNLSPRLVWRFNSEYPGSVHVQSVGLGDALDRDLWEYARAHDLTIVTRHADFGELSLLLGFPPKVVWIRLGNCSTADVERLLRANAELIRRLDGDPDTGILAFFWVIDLTAASPPQGRRWLARP